MKKILYIFFFVSVFTLTGCQKTYYRTMEAFGHHKRDILVDRVQESRDAQEEAKEQFQTALEKFTEVLNFDGGQLQEKYNQLKSELEKSQDRASQVSERIDEVESVANALFKEWENELDDYTSDRLRQSSEQKLQSTLGSYSRLIDAMRRAESKMEPVLSAFSDQVLFLKHNLNARAIASLQNELVSIESDIALLIQDMEVSIAEADTFISEMVR